MPTVALSLSLPVGYGIPPKELVGLIQRADRQGLAGVAVGELTSTDALVLLAAAAPLTRQIRLETSVLSVLTRSPSLLAMSAATMAALSAAVSSSASEPVALSSPASTVSTSPTRSPGSSGG